jgi:hypothetical protein
VLRPMAPGPGRSAAASTPVLPVEGMQKTAPSLALWARPSVRFPPGAPVWAIRCGSQVPVPAPVQQANGAPAPVQLALATPNAPAFVWLGQKTLDALVKEAVPVVSGLMGTFNDPICLVGSGGQSAVVARLPTPVHALPEFGPELQVPLTHFGHGKTELPVTLITEKSGRLTEEAPVVALAVPLASFSITFSTQVERFLMVGFGIESGGPKKQFASSWQAPELPVPAQLVSEVQDRGQVPVPAPVQQGYGVAAAVHWALVPSLKQCFPGPAPLVQSAEPVPEFAVRLLPETPKMVEAPSGILSGGTAVDCPPPM